VARNRIKLDEWELYIPNVDGQRESFEAGDGTAITVEIRHLTKRQREMYQRLVAQAAHRPEKRASVKTKMRDLIAENVRNVQNYVIEGEPILTGAELFDADDDEDLVADITKALFSRGHLEGGLAKKLRPPRAGQSTDQTKSAGGGVVDATQALIPTTPGTPRPTIPNSSSRTPRNGGSETATGTTPRAATQLGQ
jgi:hypothetical protein